MELIEKLSRMFAKRLKELMKERQLSVSGLSRETGLPRTSISNWLNLKRTPMIDALYVLSNYFEVSIDYLLGRVDL